MHSTNIKKSLGGDEYYTQASDVERILPYIKKFKHIWCPFDTEESEFVKVLTANGFVVTYGHIETGQDFFDYNEPPRGVEAIVSNPPFSLRNDLFKKCFDLDIPFALITNSNGLFDAKSRFNLFKDNEFELFIPLGRMRFQTSGKELNSPNFQSIYVCNKILDKQIVFE